MTPARVGQAQKNPAFLPGFN
ncbi:hypothetical protein AGR13a_Cc250187 [Agrobacterium genomosp. 13 str. CFBP 6927]|uniref:Uncharacterized protein n=1 Tax=Agrobacterium genomosp. 13 str. CFBP 6927 TaxID=1183428 RepID=A0ABP2BIR4_9HYPH|nr:hypothetical protein AGR13a_Cc250187 [Agrobacterium genomosp. 13 str. CFBP 6927]